MEHVWRERRRHSALGLTRRKHAALCELARRMTAARESYLREHWHPKYMSRVLGTSESLRKQHRQTRWCAADLSVHQNVMALESALGILRSDWRATLAHVRRLIVGNQSLSREQRTWLYGVMRRPDLLQRCLNGESVDFLVTT